MGAEKGALVAAIVCVLICAIPIPIAEIVIGARTVANNPNCSEAGSPVGLGTWTLVEGATMMGVLLLLVGAYAIAIMTGNVFPAIILSLVYILFHFCWLIVGAVVLARSSGCRTSGSDDCFIMAAIGVALGFLSIGQNGRTSKALYSS